MLEPKRLMDWGFAFPCSFCEEMFLPPNNQFPRCEKSDCGGLFSGRSFPRYKGMLTRSAIATKCFRCGEPAKEAIVAEKDGGMVGVCKRHLNSTISTSSDTLVPDKEHV